VDRATLKIYTTNEARGEGNDPNGDQCVLAKLAQVPQRKRRCEEVEGVRQLSYAK